MPMRLLNRHLASIPTLYVMLEERFPRRVPATDSVPARQGDTA